MVIVYVFMRDMLAGCTKVIYCYKGIYFRAAPKCDALEKIINFGGVGILICSQSIWVDGNTYAYKNLRELISSRHHRKKWYLHTDTFRKKNHKTLSMEEIIYGSTAVKAMDRKWIA